MADDIVTRLRAVLNAIDALHHPITDHDDGFMPITVCRCCVGYWPCPTHLLIHPMTLDEAIDTLGTVHK